MTLPHDPLLYIVAALAVILVGLAKGGFVGLGAVAMPVLALVMDPVKAAAMMLPILMVQDAVTVWSFRRQIDAPTLRIMLTGGCFGVFLGWLFASTVSGDAVRGLVGLIALVFGSYRLAQDRGFSFKAKRVWPAWLGAFWGAVSGFTSHVAHAGGPPFQVWALTRNFPPLVYIGTSSIFFAIINLVKVPAYFALGQFAWANMQLTLVFLPLAVLSTVSGVWLVKRIPPARFQTMISVLMIAVGIELLRVSLV